MWNLLDIKNILAGNYYMVSGKLITCSDDKLHHYQQCFNTVSGINGQRMKHTLMCTEFSIFTALFNINKTKPFIAVISTFCMLLQVLSMGFLELTLSGICSSTFKTIALWLEMLGYVLSRWLPILKGKWDKMYRGKWDKETLVGKSLNHLEKHLNYTVSQWVPLFFIELDIAQLNVNSSHECSFAFHSKLQYTALELCDSVIDNLKKIFSETEKTHKFVNLFDRQSTSMQHSWWWWLIQLCDNCFKLPSRIVSY